jgi:hypothetical protein
MGDNAVELRAGELRLAARPDTTARESRPASLATLKELP